MKNNIISEHNGSFEIKFGQRAIIIGERYRKTLEEPLKNRGIMAIWMPDNKNVDLRIAAHADISAFVLRRCREEIMQGHKRCERGKIILAENLRCLGSINSYLINNYDILSPQSEPRGDYPGDVSLCACKIGNRVICNERTTDESITSSGIEVIGVRQGYAKCSVCVVSDNAVITSDSGIAAALDGSSVDVLKIAQGHIRLDGFEYGFIGGASFKMNDTVYLTGRLNEHPDGNEIERFIFSHGSEIEYLTDLEAFDIGGAVVV